MGLLDLAELQLGFVGAADAVVFATPVYRGSMTGALKNLFDALPVSTLEGKPVRLVAMGASRHHFLGAEAPTSATRPRRAPGRSGHSTSCSSRGLGAS